MSEQIKQPFYSGLHQKTGETLHYFHNRGDALAWLAANDSVDLKQTSPPNQRSKDGVSRATASRTPAGQSTAV